MSLTEKVLRSLLPELKPSAKSHENNIFKIEQRGVVSMADHAYLYVPSQCQ